MVYRTLLDQALKIYGDHPHFISERARTYYKRGALLQCLQRAEDAEADLQMAINLYRQMCPDDSRPLSELKDEDFDINIMFWSR